MTLEKKREITDRIWQYSQAANMGKLVLLALVEHADDDGFCYPSQETIGRMIGLGGKAETIQRNALHHLNPLIKSGELICWKQQGKRGGRGYTNIYLIAIGLTDEQIKERIKRRFGLFDDEVDAALSQDGEVYKRLCTDRRISVEALDPKKGVKIDDKQEEKPVKIDGLNPDKVVKIDPQLPQEAEKGVKFGGGTKESFNPESKPSKESKDLSPKQKIFVTLAELCRINLKASTEKQRGQLGTTGKALIDLITDMDQFKDKFPKYWKQMDWRGKQGQAPTPPQIQEVYGDYCYWLENGESTPIQKASQNGYHPRSQGHSSQHQAGQAQGLSETSTAISAALKGKSRGGRDPT